MSTHVRVCIGGGFYGPVCSTWDALKRILHPGSVDTGVWERAAKAIAAQTGTPSIKPKAVVDELKLACLWEVQPRAFPLQGYINTNASTQAALISAASHTPLAVHTIHNCSLLSKCNGCRSMGWGVEQASTMTPANITSGDQYAGVLTLPATFKNLEAPTFHRL